jgi:nitrogen fixation protein NifU and related proteins
MQPEDVILAHYRHPHGRGSLPEPDAQATKSNPLCGECIHVDVTLDGDRVRDVRFDGDTCSIGRASASMMTDLVRGRSRDEIIRFITRLRRFVTSKPTEPDDPALGPLIALGLIRRNPARVPCALLPWDTLAEALAHTLTLR